MCYNKGDFMLSATYNTKEKGAFIYIIYKEDDSYVAVCLNLNIVEYGEEPKKLRESIEEASSSYLEAVRKENLSDEYLNQTPDKKYIDKLKEIECTSELIKKSTAKEKSKPSKPTFFEVKNLPYQGHGLMNA
jgi:hypothetical protein